MCSEKRLQKQGKKLIIKTSFQIKVNFDCKFCVLLYVILMVKKLVEIAIFNDIFLLAAIILRAKSFQIIISFHMLHKIADNFNWCIKYCFITLPKHTVVATPVLPVYNYVFWLQNNHKVTLLWRNFTVFFLRIYVLCFWCVNVIKTYTKKEFPFEWLKITFVHSILWKLNECYVLHICECVCMWQISITHNGGSLCERK